MSARPSAAEYRRWWAEKLARAREERSPQEPSGVGTPGGSVQNDIGNGLRRES